jgi:peptidoglycan hydrolase-like protein with peptidoglycan-binding domain
MFRSGGYDGVESTFGLGGPWDGVALDGELWQFQNVNRQADAQAAGNLYAASVETSDGGHPNHPWSSKQIGALVRLTVDFCRAYKRDCVLVPRTGSIGRAGLGYHELRKEWNPNTHTCPGPVREGQLRQYVIPKARAVLTGVAPTPTQPKAHLTVDGIFGTNTIRALQNDLRVMKFYHDAVDGIFGPATRVALQLLLKVKPDGVVGPVTVKAMQTRLRLHKFSCPMTGIWDRDTTRALQGALNAGRL